MSFSTSGGLALPGIFSNTSTGASSTASGSGPSKKRKRARPGAGGPSRRGAQGAGAGAGDWGDRELNEGDDVDEDELVAGPAERAVGGEDDDDGEGDEGDGDLDVDVDVDGEEGEEGGNDQRNAELDHDSGGDAGARAGDGIAARAGGGDAARAGAGAGAGAGRGHGSGGGGARGGGRGRGGISAKVGGRKEYAYDEERTKARAAEQKDIAGLLGSVMTPEQTRRYEAFSTAVIPRGGVRKLLSAKYDQPIVDQLLQPLAGLAKVFVAEMTEIALDIQAHSPHPAGPLQPYHLRLAREVMVERGLLTDGQGGGSALRPGKNPLTVRRA